MSMSAVKQQMWTVNNFRSWQTTQHTTTTVLRPFVWDYPGEPVPEETLIHPPSWSSSNLYQLHPSTTIHSILLVQITCLAIFLHNHFPCPLDRQDEDKTLHQVPYRKQLQMTFAYTYRSLPVINSILFPSRGYSTPGGGDYNYTQNSFQRMKWNTIHVVGNAW